jgi:hypothetical protein
MTAYRWTGTDKRGEQRHGKFTLEPGESLPGTVRHRFDAGWHYLRVCSGEGPVPPSFADQHVVAQIHSQTDDGRRTWWAEGAVPDHEGTSR